MKRQAVPRGAVPLKNSAFPIWGPVDATTCPKMVRTSRRPRCDGPVLVHVVTTKGKGLPYAEADQGWAYPRPVRRSISTGKAFPSSKAESSELHAKVFGQTLVNALRARPTLWDHGRDGHRHLARPTREGAASQYFDVRIPSSMRDDRRPAGHRRPQPVVAIYSTSCNGPSTADSRCGHPELPVTFVARSRRHRCGRWPHQQGQSDISYLRAVPNLQVMAPRNEAELPAQCSSPRFTTTPLRAAHCPAGEARACPLAEEGWEAAEIGRGEAAGRMAMTC